MIIELKLINKVNDGHTQLVICDIFSLMVFTTAVDTSWLRLLLWLDLHRLERWGVRLEVTVRSLKLEAPLDATERYPARPVLI